MGSRTDVRVKVTVLRSEDCIRKLGGCPESGC